MTADDLDDMAAVVEDAVGRPLDTTEALDVADRLRAIVTALPASTAGDAHLAHLLTEAAALVGRRAGIA